MKNTILTFRDKKRSGEKIAMLTCYDYTTAKLMDGCVDGILVGDSLSNTMLGNSDTLPVTMDEMITYGASVVRGCEQTMVVMDMPFMSYQISPEQALENAGRFMKETGCQAVKLEGGAAVCEQIRKITDAGIPVMAHLGLTPQSVNAFGGHKVQGKDDETAQRLLADAHRIEEAGAFAVVLECVPAPIAEKISEEIGIPAIGIGAGAGCDGQILVYQDMLGMNMDFRPKFVKHFAEIGQQMKDAFQEYAKEVREGTFPDDDHSFKLKDEGVLKRLY
jgi:3-methyl-2-oxobutanoate hydroxymethyltransferase